MLSQHYRDGVDVERHFPRLATWPGHAPASDARCYLTATQELPRRAARRLWRIARHRPLSVAGSFRPACAEQARHAVSLRGFDTALPRDLLSHLETVRGNDGQIRQEARAIPALGFEQSAVYGSFEEGLDTGCDHDHAGPVVLPTQLLEIGIDFS